MRRDLATIKWEADISAIDPEADVERSTFDCRFYGKTGSWDVRFEFVATSIWIAERMPLVDRGLKIMVTQSSLLSLS
jgi:hypothetical protein